LSVEETENWEDWRTTYRIYKISII
jgi:hypothetical protein